MNNKGDKIFAFSFRRAECPIVNLAHQIANDTKDKDIRWQLGLAGSKTGMMAEKPEEVMGKIHQQATHLSPVMEELLRAAEWCGQSHWGLNE